MTKNINFQNIKKEKYESKCKTISRQRLIEPACRAKTSEALLFLTQQRKPQKGTVVAVGNEKR